MDFVSGSQLLTPYNIPTLLGGAVVTVSGALSRLRQ